MKSKNNKIKVFFCLKKFNISLLFSLFIINVFSQTVYFDDKTKLYGIIDRFGKEILKPTYKYMSRIENGLCVFEFNNKYGILNEKGIVILKPIFGNRYQIACDFRKINDGLIPVKEFITDANEFTPKIGFYNFNGLVKIPHKFSYTSGFCNGIASVSLEDGNYNFINTKGEYLSDSWFEEFRRFNGVYYGINKNQDGELVFHKISTNKKPELVQNQLYITNIFELKKGDFLEECNNNSNKLIGFWENGLWGFKNEQGEVIIIPKYNVVGEFNDNRVLVFIKEIGYLIDDKGKIICNLSEKIPKFSYSNFQMDFLNERSFTNGLMHISSSETKWEGEEKFVTYNLFLIDINGNIIKKISLRPDSSDC